MKKILTTLFFAMTACMAIGDNLPKPVLVLNQMGYYSRINGAQIVVYDDQTVIYRKSKFDYYSVKLTAKEYSKLLLNINTEFLSTQKNQSPHIHTDSIEYYINDATWTTLTLWEGNRKISVMKLGSIKSIGEGLHKSISIEFKNIVKRLSSFKSIRAVKWIPNKVEINLWNNSYKGYKNLRIVDWNKEWPDTADINSKRWKNYSEPYYSIYLPKVFWPEFEKFWKKKILNKSKLIYLFRMNGLIWQPSFRFPLPNENFWRNDMQ